MKRKKILTSFRDFENGGGYKSLLSMAVLHQPPSSTIVNNLKQQKIHDKYVLCQPEGGEIKSQTF